jgi:hypothetical protein
VNDESRARCLHCIHSQTSFITGEITCTCPEAIEEMGEERIAEFTAGGEHDCPHFEDDQLPW